MCLGVHEEGEVEHYMKKEGYLVISEATVLERCAVPNTVKQYIFEDLDKLTSKEITKVYKYIRTHLIADIDIKDPVDNTDLVIWGLLEHGATFQKGDEMWHDSSHAWEPIPEQWYGKDFEPAGTTMERFNIQMRRKL